jgi:DNA polymerase III subunit epsilon
VSFLRRLVGQREDAPARISQADPAPHLAWWDPAPGGYFEIAGVAHHKDVLARLFPPAPDEPDRNVSATATLLPEPANPYDPNAVAVQFEGETAGYIPARSAATWGDLIRRLAAEGLRPRLTAKLWIGQHVWYVNLLAREDGVYRTPGEIAADEAAKAAAITERESAKAAKVAERAADRAEAAAMPVGICRECGGPIERTGHRGRPPVRCAACRGAAPDVATAPAQTHDEPDLQPTTAKAPEAPARMPLGAVPWVVLRRPAGWAVIDLETTGIFTKVDRIVEIAVVRLTADGEEMDTWTTMVNPQRDIGEVETHGIFASDVRGAPTFADIAPEVAARLGGARLAAHNARFDLDFLAVAMTKAGVRWLRPEALCTMVVPNRLGIVKSRRLDSCCAEIGVPYEHAHTALTDAQASAGILAYTLRKTGGRLPMPEPASDWPDPEWAWRPRLRSEPPPPRFDTTLGQLSDRVGVTAGMEATGDAALAYLAVLDAVLEDRRITDAEVLALADTAAGWGIDAAAAGRLHQAYLTGMWALARADGVVTANELHDLRMLSELLGVSLEEAETIVPVVPIVPIGHGESLVGMSVCFTGGSVVTIHGARLSREEQEYFAEQAGLVIFAGVTKGLDVLVMADPDSQSGKAQKADRYGTRRMAEPAFWRAIGVEID